LFMSLMVVGFTLNAGVQYINATGLEGPNLLAAGCLILGQVAVAVVHQLRRIGQKIPLTLL
jgi:hypothetical protein